jgi:NAD(P)-dependent dehydrogenase (short-subunit alcohol dehydrogenase family)
MTTESTDFEKPLKDKVAVVTGGGRGIGRGISLALAAHGARVVINDLGGNPDGTGSSQDPAFQVAEEIKKAGGQAAPNFDSVASMEGGERIIKTALDSFGRIDILVTCAGILRDRMMFNMTEQEWDAVLAVHLKGTFACMKHAAIAMRQQRWGRIITFTSESGLRGNVGQINYGSAKSGIGGLTKAAALDLGRFGITVNAIAPRAATRMTAAIPTQARQEIRGVASIPTDDFIAVASAPELSPDDIAPFVVYLCSDLAGNINGQFFVVYGGVISSLLPPRIIRAMYKPGRWILDELIEQVPLKLTAGVENPAPPQPAPAPAQQAPRPS